MIKGVEGERERDRSGILGFIAAFIKRDIEQRQARYSYLDKPEVTAHSNEPRQDKSKELKRSI